MENNRPSSKRKVKEALALDGRAIRLYTDRCGIDAALIPYVREMAEAGLVVIVEDDYYLVARAA